MKRGKILAALLALVCAFGCTACGDKNKNKPNEPPPTPPAPQEPLPEYDENGNKYIDLVTENEDGDLVYRGVNAYVDGYDGYPAFEDVHSQVPFAFANGKEARDVLGIVHAGGQYNFTSLSYLTEGARIVRDDIGSRVIKLFLGSDIADQYAFHADWGSYTSLAELARDDEVRRVFDMDFTTVVLAAYEFERAQWNADTPIAQTELDRVSGEFYDLTKELLRRNNDSGKTFVLQNWEGDNELTPALRSAANAQAKDTIVANYLAYNNARQTGIERARTELAAQVANVQVLGALEVNYLSYNGGGEKKLAEVVVPYSTADLFSFSDWSTANSRLDADLDYYLQQINLYRNANEKKTMNDIVLGEYGRAENFSGQADEENQFAYAMETAKIAVNKGVRYVCYWALMCNERTGGESARPTNADMKGFWLIKPNGELTKTFWYLKGLLENKNFLSVVPKAVLRLPEPEEEAIPFVEEDILFFDNFDDLGLDGYDISRNQKMQDYSAGMQYDFIKEKDRPLLSRYFDKYGLTDEVGYHVVQKKPNNPQQEYIQYEVVRPAADAEAKFVLQGFLYDPAPKSMISVAATKDGTTYETLSSVYVVDKTGDYGYLYVTTRIPADYVSVRVLFTNTKSANSWDPLICRAAFLK